MVLTAVLDVAVVLPSEEVGDETLLFFSPVFVVGDINGPLLL